MAELQVFGKLKTYMNNVFIVYNCDFKQQYTIQWIASFFACFYATYMIWHSQTVYTIHIL